MSEGRVEQWQRTRHGGFRRTTRGSSEAQSAAQMKRKSETRRLPPGLRGFTTEWARPLGLPGCPYIIRWMVETPAGSFRLHHWLAPDDDRAPHDHPWWFVTFVLRGWYRDVSPEGSEVLRAPAVRFRPANHRHTVFPGPRGAWTVIVTGRKLRRWGFWHNAKFYKANKWFAAFGHHPCASPGTTNS